MLDINLKQFFSGAKIAKAIETAPPIYSTVQDMFFPESSRQQFELPMIPFSELQSVVDCVPVVARSGEAVPVNGTSLENQYIEPLPVRVRLPLRAMELNNLKLIGMGQKQAWADRKTQNGRVAIKKTIEALCAQAVFDGRIDYPLLLDNGQYARYKVTYGADILTLAVDADAKWDAADMTLAKVYLQFQDMDTMIDEAGYGGEKVLLAGKKAFGQLLVLVEANNQAKAAKVPATVEKDGSITVGGFNIRKMTESWRDPETGLTQKKIADEEIRMVSQGNHAFFYAALDDLDANLQALPMFIKPIKLDDPSEMRLICTSKPLPAVAPKATCKAVVMA